MTDTDDRLRSQLTALAERMQVTDVTEASVRRGHQRRLRRRSILASTAVAVVVAAVVTPLATQGDSGTARLLTGRHIIRNLPPPDQRPTATAFDVAPPMTVIGSMPVPPDWSPCAVDAIRAEVTASPIAAGIAVVATFVGHECSIQVSPTPTLLDARGTRISIQVEKPAANGSPAGNGADPGAWGKVSVGFVIRGSRCGPPIRQARMTINGQPLKVPLDVARLPCRDASHVELIPGVVGAPQRPVQSPPPEWARLAVALVVPPDIQDTRLPAMQVTFTNPTSAPIQLSPTPTYLIGLWDEHEDGTGGVANKPLPFAPDQLVVPANGRLTLQLPMTRFDDRGDYPPNGRLRVTFSIAGVPTATAYTTLHCDRTKPLDGDGPSYCFHSFVPQ